MCVLNQVCVCSCGVILEMCVFGTLHYGSFCTQMMYVTFVVYVYAVLHFRGFFVVCVCIYIYIYGVTL